MTFYRLSTLGISDGENCILSEFVQGILIKSYLVCQGKRVGDLYPKDAKIQMDEDHPGIKLNSLLGNTTNMLMVSSAFRDTIEKMCGDIEIEYLPFTIIDLRGRPLSNDYWIINLIGGRDCLDYQASGVTWGTEDPTRILAVEKYVLDRKKMEGAPPLFRVKGDEAELIISQELVDEIKRQKFTNVTGKKVPFNDEL